jgi:spore photoproduct lyase
MIDTIYVEKSVARHERTRAILSRFPRATVIPCDRHGEVFNPKAQNFRLQKQKPALILARKFDHHVLDAPDNYAIGGTKNFYFSHMLNCIYDCRYCFLQGMYRSAHYLMFVNFEDFQSAIEAKAREHAAESTYFFSGYDCDSLALDHVSGFTESFLPFFERNTSAFLELRTKSVQVETLLKRDSVRNCVVAWSLNPEEISARFEQGAPATSHRIEAMRKLGERGWKLGLRLDPLIYHSNFKEQYQKLVKDIFSEIRVEWLHSVSLGVFRLPKHMYDTMFHLYPDEKLFAGPVEERGGMMSYREALADEMTEFCTTELLRYIPTQLFYPCAIPAAH